jgi:hypothetical protein
MLIEDLTKVKRIIICEDIQPFEKMISKICELHPSYVLGVFKSLRELREEIGNPKYKSEADAFARNIHKNLKKAKNLNRRKKYFDNKIIRIISSKNSLNYKELIEKLRRLIESNR